MFSGIHGSVLVFSKRNFALIPSLSVHHIQKYRKVLLNIYYLVTTKYIYVDRIRIYLLHYIPKNTNKVETYMYLVF